MGIPVLILGESGSGKSTSMRNFEPDEVGIFNVASKPLPFRKQLLRIDGAGYGTIRKTLAKATKRRYVIDDSQYLLVFEMFDKVKDTGYGKFTDMAKNFYDLLQYIIKDTPDDCIVYFLHHVQQDEQGRIKAKTVGRMLDEKLTLEGLFSIVLMARTENGEYFFQTHNSGSDTVKSPMDMFSEDRIDNDLKMVDETIREYWNLGGKQQ